MITYRGGYYSRPVLSRHSIDNISHNTVVTLVKMADRLVKQQKIHRLTQRTDYGYPLHLPYREMRSEFRSLVCNAEHV